MGADSNVKQWMLTDRPRMKRTTPKRTTGIYTTQLTVTNSRQKYRCKTSFMKYDRFQYLECAFEFKKKKALWTVFDENMDTADCIAKLST